MEKLTINHEKFVKSLNALEVCMNMFNSHLFNENEKNILIASLIKHFELCYETCWKYLKFYIEKRFGLKIDSPKKVFRECFVLKLMDDKTVEQLLDISEARNATIHDYNEESAQEICTRVNSYYLVFKSVEKKLTSSENEVI